MSATAETMGGRAQKPDWLTTPIEFEEQQAFRISRKGMRLVVLLAAGALGWAALAPMRELSQARGQLIPASQVRPVQHFEGGIVDKILVQEGEVVEQDQPLMRLQTVGVEAELLALQARAHNLLLLRERASALLAGREPDFARIANASPALVAEHRQVYRLQRDHRAREQQVLLARIGQRKSEIASLEQDTVMHHKLVAIYNEQLGMRRTLAIDGNASRRHVLESEAGHEQARGALSTTEGKIATTREALHEAEAALAESEARAHKLWSEELAKATSELADVRETLKKQADRVERLVVRAPARGRVQHVLQRSPGEVVRAGETIARIVPSEETLVAEVFVKPDDIASVRLKDKAELKVSAYDFSKYGKIKGEVASISPTTTEIEDKRSYYKVIVRFNPERSDHYAAEWKLQPGMTVDAEIVSGSKSLLQYLLKPIYRGVDAAFVER